MEGVNLDRRGYQTGGFTDISLEERERSGPQDEDNALDLSGTSPPGSYRDREGGGTAESWGSDGAPSESYFYKPRASSSSDGRSRFFSSSSLSNRRRYFTTSEQKEERPPNIFVRFIRCLCGICR